MIENSRTRTLIIGTSFPVFHTYLRFYSLREDLEICGFVCDEPSDPVIKVFKVFSFPLLPIYQLKDLENVIIDEKITNCIFHVDSKPIKFCRQIFNRIASCGNCSIEFVSPSKLLLHSHKPTIVMSQIDSNDVESLFPYHLCGILGYSGKRVSVIIPIFDLFQTDECLVLENGIHLQLDRDCDLENIEGLSSAMVQRVTMYFISWAYTVFVTSDIRRAIILSEQSCDIIIYDSNYVHTPIIKRTSKMCVISDSSYENFSKVPTWPGLINYLDSDIIIVLSETEEAVEKAISLKNRHLRSQKVFCLKNSSQNQHDMISLMRRSLSRVIDYNYSPERPETTTIPITMFDTNLMGWLCSTYLTQRKPTLQKHFEAQVDLLTILSEASRKELFVTNNDSANREAFCRLFLESHLPPGYKVSTGEIIDCFSNHTGQLDVVISNDVSPSLTMDTSESIIAPILADCVLCVIEVKTTLTTETLRKALSQLRPVKALMPLTSEIETIEGEIKNDPLNGKIITGIFSFGINGDVESKIPEIASLYPNIADFIVVPDQFGFFSAEILKVSGFDITNRDIQFGYIRSKAKGMSLAFIFGILNSIASLRRFSGSSFIRYLSGHWNDQSEALEKIKHNIKKLLKKPKAPEEPKEEEVFDMINQIGESFDD